MAFDMQAAQTRIEAAWERRSELNPAAEPALQDDIRQALALIDSGTLRVAEPDESIESGWRVHAWLKMAILLSFRLHGEVLMEGGAADPERGASAWWDKVPSKFAGWSEAEFKSAGFRAVPGCWVRHAAYVAPDVILMPSFVNIGAYVGRGTMIDTWATVGSCAQVGANCHISGGAGIGGVLEPLQASPVIIEDEVFLGARSEVVEGVIVRRGAVLSMGVFVGKSTKIVRRDTGEITYGEIPPYSVVVPGSLPSEPRADGKPAPALYCAVIIKQVDEKTRAKVSLNELLRDA